MSLDLIANLAYIVSAIFFGIAVINAMRTAYDGKITQAMGELFWSSIVPAWCET